MGNESTEEQAYRTQQLSPELEVLWARILHWFVALNNTNMVYVVSRIDDLEKRQDALESKFDLILQAIQNLPTGNVDVAEINRTLGRLEGMALKQQGQIDVLSQQQTGGGREVIIDASESVQNRPPATRFTSRRKVVGKGSRKSHIDKEKLVLEFYLQNADASLTDGVKGTGLHREDVSAIRKKLRQEGKLSWPENQKGK